MDTGHKIFQKIFPKTCSKHVWILLGTLLGIFGILKKKKNFENFRKLGPPRNTGQKNFSKNLPQNTFKTRLDAFGNDVGHFWNFEKKKIENFRKLDPPWNTGHNFFFEKITLKHVWIVLGKLLGIFGILKIFFFENFRRLDIPWKTGQKIFKKFAPKHVQNMFRYFWERFWAFLNFENFLIFKKIFEDSSLHRTLGKYFSKKLSQITIKTRLDSFGNDFGRFWYFEFFFDFFENFLRF